MLTGHLIQVIYVGLSNYDAELYNIDGTGPHSESRDEIYNLISNAPADQQTGTPPVELVYDEIDVGGTTTKVGHESTISFNATTGKIGYASSTFESIAEGNGYRWH